jgi:hypothetical protein
MTTPWKLTVALLAACAVLSTGRIARSDFANANQREKETQSSDKPADPQGIEEDSEYEELAPAALELDLSRSSPLIRELYQGTRETKEQQILSHLQEAKKLLENGADVRATDAEGRTALHWAVFGSSYARMPKVIVAYEDVANTLIGHGAEINRQDVYQDTALDYLLYSPNFEMQTLLLEHEATSGFLAMTYVPGSINTNAALGIAPRASAHTPDLLPGQTLSIRLDVPVYSDRSRTGDPISAAVTYPLCRNGEQIACKEGELLIPPGTKVNGTVLFAQKAPDKYSRPRLVLDFSNIVHKNQQRSPLYARVLNVDNARETVRNNEILGIIQPHASSKVGLAMAAIGAANPIAGYSIKGVQTVYGLSIRREIFFPQVPIFRFRSCVHPT